MHPRRTRLGGCCALASCLISSCSPCSLCRFTARSCDCCALLLALFPCPVPRYLQLGSTVLLETRRLVRFSRALRPRQRYAAASLCPSFKVYGTALPAACDCVLSRGAPRLCSNARASCCPIAVRGVNWSCASSARPAIGFVVSACRGPPSTRACCELQCDARLLLRFPSFEPIFLARSPFLPCAQTRILQARAGRETTRRREATHTTMRRWRGAGYRTEVLCRWWRGTRASAVIPGSST